MGATDMSTDVQTTVDTLLGCMVDALETYERPVARSGITIGPPVLGPSACCQECDECGGGNGQLVAYVQRIYPVDANTFGQQNRIENCQPGAVAADIAFQVARCHPTVHENLEPPSLDEVGPYADGALVDAQILWNTFGCPCDRSLKVVIRDLSMGAEPQGGCSVVGVAVTVLVKPTNPQVGS